MYGFRINTGGESILSGDIGYVSASELEAIENAIKFVKYLGISFCHINITVYFIK